MNPIYCKCIVEIEKELTLPKRFGEQQAMLLHGGREDAPKVFDQKPAAFSFFCQHIVKNHGQSETKLTLEML